MNKKGLCLLASYVHQGSSFVMECVRENFPEVAPCPKWYKTHWLYTGDPETKMGEYKVFYVISDWRDSAVKLKYYLGGSEIPQQDFNEDLRNGPLTIDFVERYFECWLSLMEEYIQHYKVGEDMIIIRYEDMVYDWKHTIDQVGEFLKLKPIYVDDTQKYKREIFRRIGVFPEHLDAKTWNDHWERHKDVGEKLGFIRDGYSMINPLPYVDYDEFYKRNGKLTEEVLSRYPKGIPFRNLI